MLPPIIQRLEDAYCSGARESEVWALVHAMGFSPDQVAAGVLREAAMAARILPRVVVP